MIEVILKKTLRSKNKSQYWLAKKTGIATNTLSRMSRGETIGIKFNVLNEICKALECNITDIIKYIE